MKKKNSTNRMVCLHTGMYKFDKGTVVKETKKTITLKSFVHKDTITYDKGDISSIETITKPNYALSVKYVVYIEDTFDNEFDDLNKCLQYVNNWIEMQFNCTPFSMKEIVEKITIKQNLGFDIV
jgi:hypothetical protein